MGNPKDKPDTCLSRAGVSLCVSHLLLGIYDRAPGNLTSHIAGCIQCRKIVVSVFARRLTDLAKYGITDNFADQIRYLQGGASPFSKSRIPKVN